MIPGEPLPAEGDVELNGAHRTTTLTVANTGDRPIQVGSHYHFFETNKALKFDRESAFGMRLNVPAGSSTRFAPGDEKEVSGEITRAVQKSEEVAVEDMYAFAPEMDVRSMLHER